MKTYYGNYLGLVVDDKDPDQRGRVKVFIPHIMPSLYEDWNKEGEDISFNITDSGLPTGLNPDVVKRLEKILPWAECAAPIFGAGPAGIYNNSTGALDRGALNCGNGNCGQSEELMSTLDGADLQARAAAAVDAGLLSRCGSQGLCARGANNILSWYVTGRSWSANNNGNASSGANARDFGPILRDRYGMSVIRDTGQYQNGDTRILTGSGGTQHMETFMNGRWYSDFAQNNSSLNNDRYDTATLYRLPGLDDPLPDGAYAAVEPDLPEEDENPKKKNPSDEPSLTADANSKTDPTKEEGTIQDEGSEEVAEVSEEATETPVEANISTRFTAYSPQRAGSSSIGLEGGYASSRVGPDGQAVVRTLQDVASGNSSYVTLAGDPSTYGQNYIIPSISFVNANGQSQTLTNVLGVVHDTGSAFTGAGTSKFDVAVDRDLSASEINTQPFLANNGSIALAAANEATIAAAKNESAIRNPAADPTVFVNTNDIPTGMFGSARTGQMVWVFFQEGDPLFPVYFAASYGQREWANVRQHSSPDKIKKVKTNDSTEEDPLQGSQTTLSLNAGGFKDTQWISDQPSGFKEDEFAFQVYGKNGSNLTFTFHTTHLNSKYDFRQHTQADAHYITGGNREDRITGDFNTFCEQDVVVTIGNWSTEALQAANNIQQVVDQAMKAAKDTYES